MDKGYEDDLKELVDEERKLDSEIKDLEERRKSMRSLILDELKQLKLDKTEIGGFSLAIVRKQATEKLDRTKLIQAGVTPDQLAKGTVTGKAPEPYLSIRKAGEVAE